MAAAAVTAMHIGGGAWLRSNVFELLPESHYEPLKETATRVVDAEFGTRLLFFIGHTDRDLAMSVILFYLSFYYFSLQ